MFFSASARLAEATADLGDLASRFDSWLEDATDGWLIEAENVAASLGEREDRIEFLLEQAALSEIGLLIAEDYLRCPSSDYRVLLSDVQAALANEDEIRCPNCQHAFTGDEERSVAYRLTKEAADEAQARHARPRRRLAILTALDLELRAVLAHIDDPQRHTGSDGTVYLTGTFETAGAVWEISAAAIGAGNVGAAAAMPSVIFDTDPEAVFFVGIAGGIKDVELGDVVAPDQVFLYSAGKAGATFIPSANVYRPTYALVSNARATVNQDLWQKRIVSAPAEPPKALIEPIAAGEQVVSSTRSATYKLIRKHYQRAVAVEMEGGGFLAGTYRHLKVESLVVRGISDLLDDKDLTDAAGWQRRAAAHAAAFAFEVIANMP